MLCEVGRFEDTVGLIGTMAIAPLASVWGSMRELNRKYRNRFFWCPVRFLIRRNRIYRGKFDTYLEELNSPKCVEFECSYIIDNIVLVYSFMYLWYSIFIVLWSFICMYLTLLFSMKSCPNCVKLAFELDIACPCDQFVFLGKYRRTENTETKFRRYRFWKESIGTYFLRN